MPAPPLAARAPGAAHAEPRSRRSAFAYLQTGPLAAILLLFLVAPIGVVVVVSFWHFTGYVPEPDFILDNYREVFTSRVTWAGYADTARLAAITWVVTLVLGFTLAYFLVFDIVRVRVKIALFLMCVIPFWTSSVIRTISWIPFLGRNGILNSSLQALGVIDRPLDFLLFSEFTTILSYVHVYTAFMMAPIFNTMARIDRSLIEAAVDAGASARQVLTKIVIPLSLPGIAIGSIFVVTLVVGDFTTLRLLGGAGASSIALMISNQIAFVQLPIACANAVALVAMVLLFVGGMLRFVDVRKEL